MIRNAKLDDLDKIAEIYAIGRSFMREHGNKNQWINGYPSIELLKSDIESNALFVLEENSSIYGVFAYFEGEDKTYNYIENGEWKNNDYYGTIHRIASNGTKKGVLKEVVSWAWNKIPNLRADTHKDNKVMQGALAQCGFEYCGVIYVEDGSPRVAYQKFK